MLYLVKFKRDICLHILWLAYLWLASLWLDALWFILTSSVFPRIIFLLVTPMLICACGTWKSIKVEYQVVIILVKQIGLDFMGRFVSLIEVSISFYVFFIMKWVLVANCDYRSLNKNKIEIASDYFLKWKISMWSIDFWFHW